MRCDSFFCASQAFEDANFKYVATLLKYIFNILFLCDTQLVSSLARTDPPNIQSTSQRTPPLTLSSRSHTFNFSDEALRARPVHARLRRVCRCDRVALPPTTLTPRSRSFAQGMMSYDGDLNIPRHYLVAPPLIAGTSGE